MPFDAKFDDIYKFGIKETAKELGIKAERVDEQLYSEGILERIYRQIRAADIIIADMTGQNPNVFYEVGFAHGLNKLCIHLTQDSGFIPFDLKHQRHIVYGSSIAKLKSELKPNLEWAKAEVATRRKSGIQLKHEITATLQKTEFMATVNLQFRIDLQNETDAVSPEIEAIYFYSGRKWNVKQNERDCGSTASDSPPYTHRYFLELPMRRLTPKSWAQLNFGAQRVWATTFGEEKTLQNSYSVDGRALIRLVTAAGNFDYEFNIAVTAEEDVPF